MKYLKSIEASTRGIEASTVIYRCCDILGTACYHLIASVSKKTNIARRLRRRRVVGLIIASAWHGGGILGNSMRGVSSTNGGVYCDDRITRRPPGDSIEYDPAWKRLRRLLSDRRLTARGWAVMAGEAGVSTEAIAYRA